MKYKNNDEVSDFLMLDGGELPHPQEVRLLW